MAQRIPLPDQLATRVMFASDRTCCVCRLEKHKVQIHHIDENPANDDFDNLAVICLHCHSDAHTTGAFVRNLTPELIRLYNSSWRDIVRMRLLPEHATSGGRKELEAEALLETSLACHSWKNLFMRLRVHGLGPSMSKAGSYNDVWQLMAEEWVPEATAASYAQYLPLFDPGLTDVRRLFDRLIQLFSDVLPHDYRAELVRVSRQLEVERLAYLSFRSMWEWDSDIIAEHRSVWFAARFDGVIRVLQQVARDADRRREELMPA